MRTSTRLIHCLVCLVPVIAVTAFAATNTIEVFNFNFGTASSNTHVDPTISPGDTVQWIWVSGNHSTTAAAGQTETWSSGTHLPPFTNSHTFTQLGTFNYFCSVHGSNPGCGNVASMSGRVFVVSPGATPLSVTAIEREGDDIRVSWVTGNIFCKTNALQRATGAADGSYTNDFTDIFFVTNAVSVVTNYLDIGAATNFPARYYRVRQVP